MSIAIKDTLHELRKQNTTFEALTQELQNIEHCLNYLVDMAHEYRESAEYSRIASNAAFKAKPESLPES